MKALVLSGGGSKGAYELGVIRQLAEAGNSYDMIAGVSVGALNGSFLAQYQKEDFKEAVEKLKIIWDNLETSKVHRAWRPFGKLMIPWRPSVFNSTPLHDFVEENLDVEKLRKSNVYLGVGAVDLQTGVYHVFDSSHPNIKKAVLASSSFPVMLTPVKMLELDWSDGGLRNPTPLKAAIDAGADEIDIVMTFPPSLAFEERKKWTAYQIARRSLDILMSEVVENDITSMYLINQALKAGADLPKKRIIKYRIIRPLKSLTKNSLDFSQENVAPMQAIGYKQDLGVME